MNRPESLPDATRGLRAGLRRPAPPWRFRPGNCLRNPLTGEVGPARIPSCDGAIAQLGERLHGMQEVVGSSPTSSTRRFRLRSVGSAIAGPTSIFWKIGSSGAGKARLGWRSLNPAWFHLARLLGTGSTEQPGERVGSCDFIGLQSLSGGVDWSATMGADLGRTSLFSAFPGSHSHSS